MSNLVTYSLEEGVATLTLDDGKANALSLDMIAAINEALDRAEQEAKVLIISGREAITCAGFDLRVIGSDPEAATRMAKAGGEMLLRIFLFPLPVIVASSGHAIGAGALLLLAADYRLSANTECTIMLNEVAGGMPLPGFGVELARARLANTAITQTVLFSQPHNPATASEVGFIDQVVEPEVLLTTAEEKARELAKLDGRTFAETKQSFRGQIMDKVAAHRF
ncbi:crotonase/enoyl-CoA hydratase family protein [Maricurvus nonylphenolicus]|uniref:crotonase/enoyl-CoA hydratase family protein n=1 Tax=Maricurvus nonylphenolicus TaxID=1008307 RepID=UPI0036F35979